MGRPSPASAAASSADARARVVLYPPYAGLAERVDLPRLELKAVEAALRVAGSVLEVRTQVVPYVRDPSVVRRRQVLSAYGVKRHKPHMREARHNEGIERSHDIGLAVEVLHRAERLRRGGTLDGRLRLDRDGLDVLNAAADRGASADVVLGLDFADDRKFVSFVVACEGESVEPPPPVVSAVALASAVEEEPNLLAVRYDERGLQLLLRNLPAAVGAADVLNLVRVEYVG